MHKYFYLKKIIFILGFFVLFTSCKSTTSAIITSKEVALKKGIYSEPVALKYEVANKQNKYSSNNTVASISKPNKQTASIPKNLPGLNESEDNDLIFNTEESSYLAEQLINSASDNLGIGYRGGGTTKEGFDCSGLIYTTFKKFDITLPRSSHEMAEIGNKIELCNAKKGDLIFFINRGQRRINHVGMITEVNGDEIKFIHSSTQSGVVVSSIKEPYYQRTFTQINRVIE